MLQKVITLTVLILLTACGSQSAGPLKDHLPGSYDLYIGTNQSFSRSGFSKSTLLIKTDGTFELACFYKSPEPPVASKGTWTIDSDTGVHFENFLDCAGVYRPTLDVHGTSLVVENSSKPQILLDPDVNIFYKPSDN